MKKKELEEYGKQFIIWGKKDPYGKIPKDVAKEGAGENRIPFAHYANSLPVYLFFAKLLKDDKKNNVHVLDIGCGTGRNISFVKDNVNKKSYQYYGIDYSTACIQYAKNQYKKQKINFCRYEGKKMPFPNNSFDFIVSSHVIEHIPKKDSVFYIKEISRILKKGGVAVIGTPNRKYCQDLFSLNPTDKKKYRLILPHEHEYYYVEIKNLFSRDKLFGKYKIYGTTNEINRQLMTEGADKIKPKKGLFHLIKFSLYSYLRSFSQMQDIMAKVGTEFLLWKMKVGYKEIMNNTYLVDGKVADKADNFIIVAFSR